MSGVRAARSASGGVEGWRPRAERPQIWRVVAAATLRVEEVRVMGMVMTRGGLGYMGAAYEWR